MKKHILYSLVLIFTILVVNVNAQEFDLDVAAAILIDAESGQILYEKNMEEKLPPASITKIMALLIAMEEVEKGNIDLEDEVTISKYAESMGGSQIYLKSGTRVKFGDLLKAVTIASANDASVAAAETIAGTYSNFIKWMNNKAGELGMVNTHFENSTGLPVDFGEHYSTAYDISIMARELVKYPQILEWASIWVDYLQLTNREAMLVNTNKLINSYPGMDGLKTGHTDDAGFCLAATVLRNDMRLISIILGADTEDARAENTTRLLDYGFNAFNKELLISKGDIVQNIEVPNGKETLTTAEVAEDLSVLIRKGTKDSINKKVVIQDDLEAPIKKGQIIGEELIIQDGQIFARVNLLAVEDIEKASFLTRIWRSFVNWIGGLIKGILN